MIGSLSDNLGMVGGIGQQEEKEVEMFLPVVEVGHHLNLQVGKKFLLIGIQRHGSR